MAAAHLRLDRGRVAARPWDGRPSQPSLNLIRRLRSNGHAREPESDLAYYPGPINNLFYRILTTETKVMQRWSLPFGVSILAVARRPLSSAPQESVDIDSLVAEVLPQGVLAAR